MSQQDDALNAASSLGVEFEGFSATPYRCPAGVWTIGYGSTRDCNGRPVTAQSRPVSKSDAKWLMERDMRAALQTVEHDVAKPLNSVQEGALIDFVYNVGSGNFASSTLLRNLNAGRYDLAAAQFDVWNKGGGRVLEGLVRRRAAEHALFLQTPK